MRQPIFKYKHGTFSEVRSKTTNNFIIEDKIYQSEKSISFLKENYPFLNKAN